MRQSNETDDLLFGQAIKDFLDWAKRKGMREQTLRGYKVDMNQFQRWLAIEWNGPIFVDEVELKDIEGFIDYLAKEKNSKPRTINRKINALSTFFKTMRKKRVIDENPMEDFERIKVPHSERVYLTGEEIERIIQAVDHPVLHYFVLMMAYTGIRVNECIHLTLDDVNLEERYIDVINGKGGKNRRVPMNDRLVGHMRDYLETSRPETDSLYFFALKRTGTVSEQYVNRVLKEATEKIGFQKHVTSHILRHSFASHLVKQDTHVAVIQRLLGHADVRTTSVYMHVQQDDLADAINRIKF